MKIIGASKVFVCDEDFSILNNGAIAFEQDRICDVGDYQTLTNRYACTSHFYEDCVLLPALINPHVHIEFSDSCGFVFGGFGDWLNSMMINRQKPIEKSLMRAALYAFACSGVGTLGAISSYGFDLDILLESHLRVVYFNELIGSNAEYNDEVWERFMQRVENAHAFSNARFHNALAAHSPYSVTPWLLHRLIKQAHIMQCPVSVHFLESAQEREWLTYSSGFFKQFFASFNPKNTHSFYTTHTFLDVFLETTFPLLFVHCVEANDDELNIIAKRGASIVSCPRSNRLLSGKTLDFMHVNQTLPCLIATDSLASNYSLNLLEELRIALFCSPSPLESLAIHLILAATSRAAKALGLENGMLKPHKLADVAVFDVKQLQTSTQEALMFLLYANCAKELWVAGERIVSHYNPCNIGNI